MRSLACLPLVLALVGCQKPASAPPAPGPALLPIDGPGVKARVRASTSPVVVLNLWATWCGPCKEEFPELVELGRAHPDDVDLVFVSLDFDSEQGSAEAFLRAQGAELPSYIKTGKDDPFIQAVHHRWSGALPATLVFGPERKLRKFWEGRVTREMLESAVAAAKIAETPPAETPK